MNKSTSPEILALRKIRNCNEVLLERCLPNVGYVNARLGEKIEPFSKLGLTRIPFERFDLGSNFLPSRNKSLGSYFASGEIVGSVGFDKFKAPFSGYLNRYEDTFYLEKEPTEFWLLSGVWGTVINIVESKSVLIETQTIDINMAVCSGFQHSGEFIVLPNPSELLISEYIKKFSKSSPGAVLYVGAHATIKTLELAASINALGVIAGGVERAALSYAKKMGMFVAGIMGYGSIPVPKSIFEVFKSVTNRHVFLFGDKNLMRIPVPEPFDKKKLSKTYSMFKNAKVGMLVLVTVKPYFGYTGVIEKISKSGIVVKLEENSDILELSPEEILALD